MLTIKPINALTDNYIWCIHDGVSAIVVDPGDAEPVIRYLNIKKLKLIAVLITHHHRDHIGGVNKLSQQYDLQVYSLIPEIATHIISDNTLVKINLLTMCLTFRVIAVPGHTLDHVVFYGHGMLFCGDTLFSVGCGRIFEGTYEQMYNSLLKLKLLDNDTLIYPAHEYTMKNINFARTIDPNNIHLNDRYSECLMLISQNLPTIPIKLGIEKLTNPFLRCDISELKTNMGLLESSSAVEVFTHLRRLRNNFS